MLARVVLQPLHTHEMTLQLCLHGLKLSTPSNLSSCDLFASEWIKIWAIFFTSRGQVYPCHLLRYLQIFRALQIEGHMPLSMPICISSAFGHDLAIGLPSINSAIR